MTSIAKTEAKRGHLPLMLRIGRVDTGDLRSLNDDQLRDRLRSLDGLPSARKVVQRELQRREAQS
jgi:hypothetical protein